MIEGILRQVKSDASDEFSVMLNASGLAISAALKLALVGVIGSCLCLAWLADKGCQKLERRTV